MRNSWQGRRGPGKGDISRHHGISIPPHGVQSRVQRSRRHFQNWSNVWSSRQEVLHRSQPERASLTRPRGKVPALPTALTERSCVYQRVVLQTGGVDFKQADTSACANLERSHPKQWNNLAPKHRDALVGLVRRKVGELARPRPDIEFTNCIQKTAHLSVQNDNSHDGEEVRAGFLRRVVDRFVFEVYIVKFVFCCSLKLLVL